MIAATQRCGCLPKQVSLLTANPLSKHSKSCLQRNTFGQTHRSQRNLNNRCCPIHAELSSEIQCPAIISEKSLSPSVAPKAREKNVSEITGTGMPYKEIEAIINDNRMVLRIQKMPIEEKWDPPCDCGTENSIEKEADDKSSMTSALYGDDIIFRKAEEHGKPCSVRQERIVEPSGSARRTVTVVSYPDSENGPPGASPLVASSDEDKREKNDKLSRSIDLEENPNLFILKIRKKSETSDGRENIDLEFRTFRPWRPKPRILRTVERPAIQASLPEEKILNGDAKKNGKKKRGKRGKK